MNFRAWLAWHWFEHRTYVLGCLCFGLVAGLITLLSHGSVQSRHTRWQASRSWPIQEAVIREVAIRELDHTSQAGVDIRRWAKLQLDLSSSGRSVEWHGTLSKDLGHPWHRMLRTGERLEVRVDPDHPERVSLIDYGCEP